MRLQSLLRGRYLLLAGVLVLAIAFFGWRWTTREARDADALLRIANSVVLGSTTESEFLARVKPYERYRQYSEDSKSTSDNVVFWVVNHRAKSGIGISVLFEQGRPVERSVGFGKLDCCSVEIEQHASYPPQVHFRGRRAIQHIVGDPHYLTFSAAPNLNADAVHEVFDFQTNCLGPLSHCNSVDALHPLASTLLRESIEAGY